MDYCFNGSGDINKDDKLFLETAEALIHDCSRLKELYGLLANLTILIQSYLENVNWCGFYILEKDKLFLGPFQGNMACETIKVGSGVCGTSIEQDCTMLIEDVNKFPGHIACDVSSRSEIVTPFYNNNKEPFGVIDWDSSSYSRFTQNDVNLIEKISQILSLSIKF